MTTAALITEMLVEKRLGQRRLELTDELYQTWREVEQRGLKETREYRDVLLGADRHAFWLAGLVKLVASPISSEETKRTDTLDAPKKPLSKLVNAALHSHRGGLFFFSGAVLLIG